MFSKCIYFLLDDFILSLYMDIRVKLQVMRNVWKKGMVWVAVLVLLSSCFTPKKVLYLQDLTQGMQQELKEDYETKIKKDDLLQILIMAQTPDAAKPFNLSALVQEINSNSGNSKDQYSYLVDINGCIDLPVLGRMTVEGMTTQELKNILMQKLKEKNLIKDPLVTVRIQNFKVLMLGEVKSPGAIEVKGERVTLLDAISQAGDLTMQGRRDRIAVIREENGKRTAHYLDLKSKAIFDSPYFYLKQNDVVYVEPNDTKTVQYRSGQMGNVTPWISLASSILSLITLIVALK